MARKLHSSRRWSVGSAAALLLAASFAQAQAGSTSTAPQSVTDVLEQISGRAAVIFVGQVVAVRRFGTAPGAASGVVEVDFRVDTAIRGCTAGAYTLREWAGLWVVNNERYHVGERLLMLLHAPSAAGLSSPVDGIHGTIPIRQGGSATPYAGSAPPSRFVDLRWLGAKLPRTVSYRNESAGMVQRRLPPVPLVASGDMVAGLRAGSTGAVAIAPSSGIVPPPGVAAGSEIAPLSGEAAGGSIPAQQASVGAVVAMLTAWEKARHATP